MRLNTSLRARSVDSTTRLAQAAMPALGITRVTDITRLDRIGLPVFASVRPRGRTLRVHAGKGLEPGEARIGALMEAIEFAAAEADAARGVDAWATGAELEAQWPDGLCLDDFAPRFFVKAVADAPIPAVTCEALDGRGSWLLPADLVQVLAPAPCGGPALFGWTTNGLASGNTLDEATLHALFEVLERDTLALNSGRDRSALVDPASLPPALRALAARWRGLGIELLVRHVPNALALPCFEAYLHEPASTDVNIAGGSGLHVERGIALARAVSEAAQSRLSTIHGARDDIVHYYAKYSGPNDARRRENETQLLARLQNTRRRVRFGDVAQRRAVPGPALLDDLVARLPAAGLGRVFRRHLAGRGSPLPLRGLHVVKVVVARAESLEGNGARVGPRLGARLAGHDG